MLNNNYSIADLDYVSRANQANKTTLEKPNPVDVGNFSQAMSQSSQSGAHCAAKECAGAVDKAGNADGDKKSGDQAGGDQMEKILMMLMELLAMLTKMMKEDSEGDGSDDSAKKGADAIGGAGNGGGATQGAGKGGGEKPAKVENGNIVAENNVAAGDGQIPKPTEHKQSFELGGKQVTMGGDGSASAAEVQQTKETLTNLYNNSSSFKQMLDSSPNESFEVSVGKRDDNMSWGNADGRVFMNINNIKPDSGDGFESLMAHELAHAGVNMQHGDEMKQFEQTVAKEA